MLKGKYRGRDMTPYNGKAPQYVINERIDNPLLRNLLINPNKE